MAEIITIKRDAPTPTTFNAPNGKNYVIDTGYVSPFKVGDLCEYCGAIYTIIDFPTVDRIGIEISDRTVESGKRQYNVPQGQCRHIREV